MSGGPLSLLGVLHKIARHPRKLLTKYDLDKAVKVEDHLENFYLHLQTLEVPYDDVVCRMFTCTLDGREIVWYHSLPPNSIQNWRVFKKIFLEKFVDDKTSSMLLKELGNLKMEQKEKVKYFNHRFNRILNNLPAKTKPYDSITIDYYASALPTNIAQFVKRTMKQNLTKNYEYAIIVGKELSAIGVITGDEPAKDSKDTCKKSQASVSKAKEKKTIDL